MCLALLVLISMGGMAQEIPLRGNVVVQNSLYRNGELAYVSGAQISAPKAATQRTGDKGEFTLIFVGKEAGKPADLRCEHPDFELVDSVELAQVKVGDRMPVRITVAKAGHLAQAQAEYNRINLNALYAHRDALIKQLRGSLEEQAAAMKQMEQDFGVKLQDRFQAEELLEVRAKALEARLPEFSLKMAKLNLDFADKLLVEAFQYFEQGDLVQALKVLNDSILDASSHIAISGYQRSILDSATATQAVKTWREGIQLEIEKNQFKADGELLKFQYLAAALAHERILELLLALKNGREDAELGRVYALTSMFYFEAGLYAQSLTHGERALAICNKVLPPNHADLATFHNNLALAHRAMGNYANALAEQENAIRIQQKLNLPDNPILSSYYNDFAAIYFEMCIYTLASKARMNRDSAIMVMPILLFPSNLANYNNLAMIHPIIGDLQNALEAQKKVIEVLQKAYPPDHPDLATAYSNLALIYQEIGDLPEALLAIEKAIAIGQRALPSDHPDLALTYFNMGTILFCMNHLDSAIEFKEKAWDIWRMKLSLSHPHLAILKADLGDSFSRKGHESYRLGDVKGAHSAFTKAASYTPDVASIHHALGVCHYRLGDYEAAIAAYDHALELDPSLKPPYLNNTALTYAKWHKPQEAQSRLEQLQALMPDAPLPYRSWSLFHALQGDLPAALQNLEKAIDLGFNDRAWLDNEDAFDQLRDDPRYQALFQRMKP